MFSFSEQLSRAGLEEYALRIRKNGLRPDLYPVPRLRAADRLRLLPFVQPLRTTSPVHPRELALAHHHLLGNLRSG